MKLNAYQRGSRDGLMGLVRTLYKMVEELDERYDKDKQKLDSGPFKDSHMHKHILQRDLEKNRCNYGDPESSSSTLVSDSRKPRGNK